jgi:hypothetical protein
VAHPHGDFFAGLERREHSDGVTDAHTRRPVFTLGARLDLAAQVVRHELLAVTDAEDRDTQRKNGRIALRRVFVVDALRAAAENDGARVDGANRVRGKRAGLNFAVDVTLADAARDELRVLRAVIEDQDGLAGSHGAFG